MMLVDLFSGIGGFSLAAHAVGIETVAFCEIGWYQQRVLKRHWPDVPVFDDIKEVDDGALADAVRQQTHDRTETSRQQTRRAGDDDTGELCDVCGGALILTAGFPCQDISYAGKGAGLAGERSGLFFDVARLADELRPDYLLLENVSALLTRGLDAVLGTLASLRYDALWSCVPACAVGAPHRRDRIWLVAVPRESGSVEERLLAMHENVMSSLSPLALSSQTWPTPTATEAWSSNTPRNRVQRGTGRVFKGKAGLGLGQAAAGLTWDAHGENAKHIPEDMRLNPDWVEALMGYPVGFTLPDGEPLLELPRRWPALFGDEQHEWEPPRVVPKDTPLRTPRLEVLGNSIVPHVGLLWMRAIAADSVKRGGQHHAERVRQGERRGHPAR